MHYKDALDTYEKIDNSKRRFYKLDLVPNMDHDVNPRGVLALRLYFDKWVGRKVSKETED